MDILIVKQPWLDYILDNLKTWEVRGTDTKKRGRILLGESGSGLLKGSVILDSTSFLSKDDYEKFPQCHRIPCGYDELPYKNPHIWLLKEPCRFKEPTPYKHPQGAVIWVKANDYEWCEKLKKLIV